eukprot:TRINITY_DN4126_c0_g2_i1.p3 TRINITY_DN4126_c0_g2~~TRINITY_DN4126_c0_g2_i1.p3  ORF type:complete len:137 (-),score=39.54 TRINITY_DN4126_c0_g2_i1:653-1063(-)
MARGKKSAVSVAAEGAKKTGKKGKPLPEECTVETTIHLAKFLKGRVWKRRAPLSIDIVKRSVKKIMHTEDIRIDSKLNEHLWSRGIKGVPRRVRVMLKRKRSEIEGAKEPLYTIVELVPVEHAADFHRLLTTRIGA